MRRLKRVEVEWNDASHYGGSENIKESRNAKLVKMRTIGYLLKRGKKAIVIAGEYNEWDDTRDRSVIPRHDVMHITYLKEE